MRSAGGSILGGHRLCADARRLRAGPIIDIKDHEMRSIPELPDAASERRRGVGMELNDIPLRQGGRVGKA